MIRAAWARRMLAEITGRYRKENNRPRNTISMRRVAEVSGVSLATIHYWIPRIGTPFGTPFQCRPRS